MVRPAFHASALTKRGPERMTCLDESDIGNSPQDHGQNRAYHWIRASYLNKDLDKQHPESSNPKPRITGTINPGNVHIVL